MLDPELQKLQAEFRRNGFAPLVGTYTLATVEEIRQAIGANTAVWFETQSHYPMMGIKLEAWFFDNMRYSHVGVVHYPGEQVPDDQRQLLGRDKNDVSHYLKPINLPDKLD